MYIIYMKLSDWAKNNGLSYRTAWNLFKAGKLPVKAIQLESGTIIVTTDVINNSRKIELCEELLKILRNE